MKKITFKKLLELSEVKLGMTKQYYVPKEDVQKDEPTVKDDTWFGIKTVSEIQTTLFDKKVYLCEWTYPKSFKGMKGWINMEVVEYHQLEDVPSMSCIH
jgi:hypothetical protein